MRREKRRAHMRSAVAHIFTYMSSHTAALPSIFSSVSFFHFSVESELHPDSMDSRALVDPMFATVPKQLSLEAQEYLDENGLSDPGVYESFLGDPDTQTTSRFYKTANRRVRPSRQTET